jgi:hypothetical protein
MNKKSKKLPVTEKSNIDIEQPMPIQKSQISINLDAALNLMTQEKETVDSFIIVANTSKGVILSSEGDSIKLIAALKTMIIKQPNIGKMLLNSVIETMDFIKTE